MTDFIHNRQGGDGRYFHGEDYEGMGTRFNAMVFGSIGLLAGKKFYDRWGPYASSQAELLGASVRHGALMAIRWKAWTWGAVLWLVTTPLWIVLSTGWLDRAFDDDPTNWGYQYPPRDINITEAWFQGFLPIVWGILVVHVVVGLLGLGVTYNRAIRESDFTQRRFYRMMAPWERLVEGIDWKILHSLLVVPLVLAIVSYNQ